MRTILTHRIKPLPQIYHMPEGAEGGGEGGEGKEGAEGQTTKPKNLQEFQARFAASKVAPTLLGKPPIPPKEKETEGKEGEGEEIEGDEIEGDEKTLVNETIEERSIRLQQERIRKRAGSNVPKILEDKHKAEAERDELKTKVADFEKLKTENETKIADLQKKIDSGELSSAKEAEYTQKIEKLEAGIAEERDGLVKENERLKTRVSYFDLAEDDNFKKEFLEPAINAYAAAADAIGADEQALDLLERAAGANSAALNARTNEARLSAQRARDEILTQIEEKLGGFTGKRFSAAVSEYIVRTQNHAKALENHSETAKVMREKLRKENTARYAKTLETWNQLYESSNVKFEEDATLSDEEKETAKELGLKYEDEYKQAGILGKKVANGQATPSESIEMIQKGKLYPVFKARIAVLESRLAAAQAVIKKQRGGGTGGGNDSREKVKEEPKTGVKNENGERMTRNDWQKSRFGASRPGLVKTDK